MFQGGLGFVQAGIKDTDSGIAKHLGFVPNPLGVGIDYAGYAVNQRLALTADFVINLTSLGETVRAGGQELDLHTNVMQAFYPKGC